MVDQSHPTLVNNNEVVEMVHTSQHNADNATNNNPVSVVASASSGQANSQQDSAALRQDLVNSQAPANSEKTGETNKTERSLEVRIIA